MQPPKGPTGQEEREISPNLARASAVTAFVASPLLHEPDKLKVDHISAFLALVVDGPIHKEAMKLLAPEYSQHLSFGFWAAWLPHLSPTPDHPPAASTMLRDVIL